MFLQPALSSFVDDVLHVPRGDELALLDVHRAARRGRGDQQVGLAAEERRDLQHVAHLRHRRRLVRFVDVGRHGQAGFVSFTRRRTSSPRFHSRAAKRLDAGAIGLVERRLEDELDRQVARRSPSSRAAIESVSSSLSITHGTGDHQQRSGRGRRDKGRFGRDYWALESSSCAKRSVSLQVESPGRLARPVRESGRIRSLSTRTT